MFRIRSTFRGFEEIIETLRFPCLIFYMNFCLFLWVFVHNVQMGFFKSALFGLFFDRQKTQRLVVAQKLLQQCRSVTKTTATFFVTLLLRPRFNAKIKQEKKRNAYLNYKLNILRFCAYFWFNRSHVKHFFL